MAKAKKTELTDLQRLEEDLRSRGLEYSLLEYSHAYIDVVYQDESGERLKVEFKPDGSELKRDAYGAEAA